MQKQRICIVSFYVGKLPSYMSLFVDSARRNSSVDFLIFNDTFIGDRQDGNIRFVRFDLSEFNVLAKQKLEMPVYVKSGWKLNEFKPAFGLIFEDYLRTYDFWAWSDIDVIWGDLRQFLTEDLLKNSDVVVPKTKWTTGHFTLIRNSPLGVRLFQHSPSYEKILLQDEYVAFEESCHRWEGTFYTIDELTRTNQLVSMFDVVKNLDAEKKLRATFREMMREYPQPFHFQYNRGTWTDLNDGSLFMYLHLIVVKKIWRFYLPEWKLMPEQYFVNAFGLQKPDQTKGLGRLLWWICRGWFCFKGILVSVRKQRMTIGGIARKVFGGKERGSHIIST